MTSSIDTPAGADVEGAPAGAGLVQSLEDSCHVVGFVESPPNLVRVTFGQDRVHRRARSRSRCGEKGDVVSRPDQPVAEHCEPPIRCRRTQPEAPRARAEQVRRSSTHGRRWWPAEWGDSKQASTVGSQALSYPGELQAYTISLVLGQPPLRVESWRFWGQPSTRTRPSPIRSVGQFHCQRSRAPWRSPWRVDVLVEPGPVTQVGPQGVGQPAE